MLGIIGIVQTQLSCGDVKDFYTTIDCCSAGKNHVVDVSECAHTLLEGGGKRISKSPNLGYMSPSVSMLLQEGDDFSVSGTGSQDFSELTYKVHTPSTETPAQLYQRFVSEFEVLWNGLGWPVHSKRADVTRNPDYDPAVTNTFMNDKTYTETTGVLLKFISRVYKSFDATFYTTADEVTKLKVVDLKNALEIARKMAIAFKKPTTAFASTIFDSDDVFASHGYFISRYGLIGFSKSVLRVMDDPKQYLNYIERLYSSRDGVERLRQKIESNIVKGIQTFKYAQQVPLFSREETAIRDIYNYGAERVTLGKSITGSWWDVYQTTEYAAHAARFGIGSERYLLQFMARTAQSLVNTSAYPVSEEALVSLSAEAKVAFDTYFNALHGFFPLFDKYVAMGRDNVNDRIGCLGLYPENRYKKMVSAGLMSQAELDAAFDAHAEECKDKFVASIHFSSGIDTDVSGISWIQDAKQAKLDLIAASSTMQGYFQKGLANYIETMGLTEKEAVLYEAMTVGSDGGKSATVVVSVVDGGVSSATMTDYGIGYLAKPTVIVEGDGVGAQLEVLEEFFAGGKVWKIVVSAKGTGYTSATARIVGETAQARVELTVSNEAVSKVDVVHSGENYVSAPTVVVTGCTTPPQLTVEVLEKKLASVTIQSAGTGCLSTASATVNAGHPLNDIADFMGTITSLDVDTFTYGTLEGPARYDEILRQSNEFNRKSMLAMDYVSYQEDIDGLYGMPEMVVMSKDSNAKFSIEYGRNYVVGQAETRTRINNMNLAEAIPSHLYQEYRLIPKKDQDFVGNFGVFSWRESFSNTQIQQLSSAYGVVSGDYNEAVVLSSTGELNDAFDVTFDRDHQLLVDDIVPGLYIGKLVEQGDYISQLRVAAVLSSNSARLERTSATRQETHFEPDPTETTIGNAATGTDHTYASTVLGLNEPQTTYIRKPAAVPKLSYATTNALEGYKVHLPRTLIDSNTASSANGEFTVKLNRLYTRDIKVGDIFHLRNVNTLKTLPGGDFAFDNLDYHIVTAVNGTLLSFTSQQPIQENQLSHFMAIYLMPPSVVENSIAGQLYSLSILWGDVGCNMDIGEKVTYDNFADIIALAGQGIGRVEQRPRRYCTSIGGSQPYAMGVKFFTNLWNSYVAKSPNTSDPKVFFKLALQSPRQPWSWYTSEVDRITSEAEAAFAQTG